MNQFSISIGNQILIKIKNLENQLIFNLNLMIFIKKLLKIWPLIVFIHFFFLIEIIEK